MATGFGPFSQLTATASSPMIQQLPSAPRFVPAQFSPAQFSQPQVVPYQFAPASRPQAVPSQFPQPQFSQPQVVPSQFLTASSQSSRPQVAPPQFSQPQVVPSQFLTASSQSSRPQVVPSQFPQPQVVPSQFLTASSQVAPAQVPPVQFPQPQVAPSQFPQQQSILPAAPSLMPSAGQTSILPAAQPIPLVSLNGEQEEEVVESTPSAVEVQQSATVIRRGFQTRIPAAETNLAELTYSELDLMPMRCYGCGEVIRQIAIEDALKSGRNLKGTLDQLDYPLLCCRDLIRGQVSVLEVEKRQAAEARIRNAPLNLATTSRPSTFSLGTGRSTAGLRVIDESPPGTVETAISFSQPPVGGELITGSEESFLQEGATPGDAYQYFMMQTQTDFEAGGDED